MTSRCLIAAVTACCGTIRRFVVAAALTFGLYSKPTAASSPPAPGCPRTEATFSNKTPVAITAAAPNVVQSQIVVSGLDPFLWGVDVQTFITHTFNDNLEITLTSPAGTVVMLATDNRGGNDNVFNGTVWDEDAGDVASDHAYANLVVATPLSPEEGAAAAFTCVMNGVTYYCFQEM